MRITVRPCRRAHVDIADVQSVLRLHDKVLIRHCPPISARKRFKLEKIISSPDTVHELAHARSVPSAFLICVKHHQLPVLLTR